MASENTPKVFKKGYGSNFVIPFAIVLIGSLIIFGVTKMLQTDRGYKDLVRELHSKPSEIVGLRHSNYLRLSQQMVFQKKKSLG